VITFYELDALGSGIFRASKHPEPPGFGPWFSAIKAAAVGKNEKMEILNRYLSEPEFRQRIEAIVEAFIGMQEDPV
jgi:hypothetical protein